jgi:hypothetical protein
METPLSDHMQVINELTKLLRSTFPASDTSLLNVFLAVVVHSIFFRNVSSQTTTSPVSPQRQGVLPLPRLSPSSLGVVVSVTLVETSALLARSSETTHFAVLVHGVDDPIDAGVETDSLVLGVDKDDFVVLVGGVLVDPVGVEDAEVGAATTDTLFGDGTEGALELELVDTLVGGLAYRLRIRCFALDFVYIFNSYRKWHPWELASCDHHVSHGHDR